MKEHYKKDYFPLKLAIDEQFCNRVKERELLNNNIATARHTVLVSPRRYGKSSLVHFVVNELNLPFASIDLFLAHDDEAVTKRILDGLSMALSQLMTPSQKTLKLLQNYFTNFRITISLAGFSIESAYSPGRAADAVELIFDALRSLARLAKDHRKKVVFFIDEFQDIQNADTSKSIQGAIRHVAQETSDVVFIFSGSSRHLLLQIFDDKSKPLYMLCDKLILERMSSADYLPYLQKSAKAKWGKQLDESTLSRIFSYTELHPFYINMLCHELWKNAELVDVEEVQKAWENCYELEYRRLIAEVDHLTLNQQKILKFLANNSIHEVTGKDALALTKISTSSMLTGIKNLIEKDMIYRIKKEDPMLPGIHAGQYKVLDPLLGYSLRKYS